MAKKVEDSGRKDVSERKADVLKLDGDWQDAMKQAIGKPKPAEGWPDPPGIKRRKPGGGRKPKRRGA